MNKNLYYCSNMLILVCFYNLSFVIEIANFPLDFKQLKQDLELSNVSHDWDHQKAEVSRSKVYSVLFKLITKASFTVSLIVRIDFEVLITNIFFFFIPVLLYPFSAVLGLCVSSFLSCTIVRTNFYIAITRSSYIATGDY